MAKLTYIQLKVVDESHIDVLLPLVRRYHDYEQIDLSDQARKRALLPLLTDNVALGKIWLIYTADQVVGYLALCFGYSIEFGGRDAFVDEFFIEEEARGKGLGAAVLEIVKRKAVKLGIVALHLEVARTNERAEHFYERAGFKSRARFSLMSCELKSDSGLSPNLKFGNAYEWG